MSYRTTLHVRDMIKVGDALIAITKIEPGRVTVSIGANDTTQITKITAGAKKNGQPKR